MHQKPRHYRAQTSTRVSPPKSPRLSCLLSKARRHAAAAFLEPQARLTQMCMSLMQSKTWELHCAGRSAREVDTVAMLGWVVKLWGTKWRNGLCRSRITLFILPVWRETSNALSGQGRVWE